MTIEPARPADIPALAGLIGELFSLEPDFTADQKKQEAGLTLMVENPSAIVLTLRDQDHPVGVATGQLVVSTSEGRPSLWVEDVFIKKEYRGQGWGQKLLEGLKTWAAERGARRIQLLADRENAPALEFYQKTGWQKTRLVALRTRVEE